MSLINDALKKAQRQRTGEVPPLAAMPGVGGETAARIAKRGKPAGFNTLLLRAGLGAGALLAVLVVGGYYALRKKPETGNLKPESSTSQSSLPVAKPPDEPRQLVSPKPGGGGTSQVSEPAGPVAFSLPVVAPSPVAPSPAPGPTGPPVVAKPAPSPAAKRPDEPAVGPAKAGEPAPAPSPAKMDNKAITYIENLRIAGIRASATDPKVLMSDRVYRPGDMVERDLGLKLVGITSNSLLFEDEAGARYTRSF